MDTIAFLIGPYSIYWSTVMLALASAVGVLLFWCFYLWDSADRAGAFLLPPLALVLGIFGGRLAHWYFRPDVYGGFLSAMTDYSMGGFALVGTFLGVFLAVGLTSLLHKGKTLFPLLDAAALAGCGAISLGRLSCFCNSLDRGQTVAPGGLFSSLLLNPTTGSQEYRLATFLLQSIVAALIFLGLAVLFFWQRGGQRKKDGDLFFLFCLYYGGTQAVLDSTRYDSLFFRSNGFISVVQILGLLAVLGVLLILTLRYCKTGGWKPGILCFWGCNLLLLSVAGYMEYYVQRHSGEAVFAYSLMSAAMALVLILATALWAITRKREIPRSLPTIYPKIQ